MCLISIFFCIFAPCDWINRVFIAEKITEIHTGFVLDFGGGEQEFAW